ncbi:hypothetical protein B0H10DRAFT_1649256, partial [Mycena sp. CBHHK59/15]
MRAVPVVPVLLGLSLLCPDHGDGEYERWCRSMLILFKVWRNPSDLRGVSEPWSAAFNRMEFLPAHVRIMHNMNVENECQDTQDEHDRQQR